MMRRAHYPTIGSEAQAANTPPPNAERNGNSFRNPNSKYRFAKFP